jgi:hypothetical protein
MGVAGGRSQGVIYTDRSIFNAPLQSSATINFESLTPSSPFSTGISPVVVSGVTFTNSESRLFITSSSTGVYPIPGTRQYLWNFDSTYPVGIYLPGGINAFGADFSGGITPNAAINGTLTVNLVGGQTYTYNFPGLQGSWSFFGVAFAQNISSLVFHDGGQFFPGTHEEMLDNVTFGVATVPEPHSAAIAIAGMLVCIFSRRRRL